MKKPESDSGRKILNPKEMRVLGLFYGWDDKPKHSITEIAKKLSYTREEVRAVHYKGISKIQAEKDRLIKEARLIAKNGGVLPEEVLPEGIEEVVIASDNDEDIVADLIDMPQEALHESS